MQNAVHHFTNHKTILLKTGGECVKLDEKVYNWIASNPRLSSLDFLNNLRRHSSGCVVFQKTKRVDKGLYQTETLYLHKIIAEEFVPKPKKRDALLAGTVNEDKLDLRIENLVWRSRADASRLRRTTGKSGFLGVYQEGKRFRSVITFKGKPIHLGMFNSATDAASAFNRESIRLFGKEAKLNKI